MQPSVFFVRLFHEQQNLQGRKDMKSRKAIVLLLVGAMLIAATAGAFAQGFGGMWWGPGGTQGYGYWQWYEFPNQPPMARGKGPSMMPGKGPALDNGRMLKAYGFGAFPSYKFDSLSAADKDKVVKIMQDTQAKVLPLQNELRTERFTLNTLLWSSNPDKAKIDESIGRIADLQKQIQEIRADGILEINKIFEASK
jgi:hypothetical protein